MSRYFSVFVWRLFRLISAIFWAWLWLVSLYQLRLYSESESFSMEMLQKKVAEPPTGRVNVAGKKVTVWERENKEQTWLQQAQVSETAVHPVREPGMQRVGEPTITPASAPSHGEVMDSYVPNPEAPRIPQLFRPQVLKAPSGIYKNLPASACEPSPMPWPAPSSPVARLWGLPAMQAA